MEGFAKLLDRILNLEKISAKTFLFLCLSTGFLLIAPDSWLLVLGLQAFMEDFGWVFGVVFVVSGTLLLIKVVDRMIEQIQESRTDARIAREVEKSLGRLDEYEKSILREFYIQERNTIQLPIEDPVVAGLLEKHILDPIGAQSRFSLIGEVVPVRVHSSVRSLISPELIGLPTPEELTEEKIEKVKRSRPRFIKLMRKTELGDR